MPPKNLTIFICRECGWYSTMRFDLLRCETFKHPIDKYHYFRNDDSEEV